MKIVGTNCLLRRAVRIAPTGTVQVHGEIWTAKSEEPIEIGESVQIQSVKNLQL